MATKLPLFYLIETGFKLTKHVRKSKEWVRFSLTNTRSRNMLLKRNPFLALSLHALGLLPSVYNKFNDI